MPKCPKCNDDLTFLHQVTYGLALVEEFDGENWEEVTMRDTSEYRKYWECPYCGEVLFKDDIEEAIEFLLVGQAIDAAMIKNKDLLKDLARD